MEVDGYTYHRDRRAFANDRARDREALRRGQRTARFPADEIVSTPAAVAQELRGAPQPHLSLKLMSTLLPIGEVVKRSGVAASALRFYEERGLDRV